MFEERPSPVVARAEAARKLPRLALLALLFVFIVPGLITRDFWSSQELSNFALALTMYQGSLVDWVLPNVDATPFYSAGPLAAWLAALCMKLFGWITGLDGATRLSTLIWFASSNLLHWYGTWYLARRSEAQPVVLAFGGEANAKDFGRVVADGALLLFIGTFGLFVPLRELNIDTALLAIICTYFFSLSYSLHRPTLGPINGLSYLSKRLDSRLCYGLGAINYCVINSRTIHSFEPPFITRASSIILVSVGTFFIWPIFAVGFAIETVDAWFDGWWQTQVAMISLMSVDQMKRAVSGRFVVLMASLAFCSFCSLRVS